MDHGSPGEIGDLVVRGAEAALPAVVAPSVPGAVRAARENVGAEPVKGVPTAAATGRGAPVAPAVMPRVEAGRRQARASRSIVAGPVLPHVRPACRNRRFPRA